LASDKITAVTFAAGSQLQEIGSNCFAKCSLISLCIPASVVKLNEACFGGETIEWLIFERGSRLAILEDSYFG
jgi:hypothetical protein